MQKYAAMLQHAFRTMPYAPMAFITAKTGKNVKALLNLSQSMFKQAKKRVATSTLNRVIQEAVDAHPPAQRENRTPKIYYATQVGTEPPTVVVFVNSPPLFDATYQRYLLNVFREKLPYHDIPIKLYLRSRSRSDAPLPGRGQTAPETPEKPPHKQPQPVLAREPLHVSDLDREVNELMAELEESAADQNA
jgi:GTP-binding protein